MDELEELEWKAAAREDQDKIARWRRTDDGWIVCDPSADAGIACLPVERLLAIRAQADALAREGQK